MSGSPLRKTRRSRSSQRDESLIPADSSSGHEEEVNGDNDLNGGRTDDDDVGMDVRQRDSLLDRLTSNENKSRTPSPSKSYAEAKASPKRQAKAKLGTDSKPTKSFDDFVRNDTKKGVFEDKTLKDYEKKPRESSEKKKFQISSNAVMMMSLGIFVAFLGVFVFWYSRGFQNSDDFGDPSVLNTPEAKWKKLQKTLFQEFKNFNAQYTHQLSATNVHLLSAVNSTFDVSEPRQPSAITVLIPPSMKRSPFPKCFALKFASAVNQMFAKTWKDEYQQQDVKVVNSEYFHENEDINKIHEDFKQYFSSGGQVLVVEDVDQLKKEEHFLVFHSFCDNYKAPHKRATFVFLVDVPKSVADKYTWNYSQAADISYSALNEAWSSSISDDHRAAIIARVSATAVLLKDGDSC